MNIISCCHKCKVAKFHFRNEEYQSLTAFYRKHYACIFANPGNVETKEDQLQEEIWMRKYIED